MANTPQTYTCIFRSFTPEKLAAIIAHEDDYHSDAVTAARLELTARMLPMEELDRIYALAEESELALGSDGIQLDIGENPKITDVKNLKKGKE